MTHTTTTSQPSPDASAAPTRGRRALLQVAAASLATAAAGAALHAGTASATVDTMFHGTTNNADAKTGLTVASSLNDAVFQVENNSATGSQRTGIYAYVGTTAAPSLDRATAIVGVNALGTPGSIGVLGKAVGDEGAIGVLGSTDTGIGVMGAATAAGGCGVDGGATNTGGIGVRGRASHPTGVGVHAVAWTSIGTALKVEGHSTAMVASVRSFAQGLRPPILDDLGLAPAIDRLLREFSARSSIQGRLRVRGPDRHLPSDVSVALYRITQEALRNVERHSDASCVKVSLNNNQRATRLLIEDDGRGFSAPALIDGFAEEAGLGLIGMQERARALGGKLTIDSTAGSGTRVTVDVPFTPSRDG